MKLNNIIKITVIGMGAVGTAVASALLQNGLCSQLLLCDKLDAKAEGEAWDFAHAAALLPPCVVDALPFSELCGSEITLLTAGVKSRVGEGRLELLERNLVAAEEIATQLERNPLPRIFVVLTNPVDVITEFFTRRWKNRDVQVIGSGTALDSFRLRHLISLRLKVSPLSVQGWVVGEHGDSSVTLLSGVQIGCTPLHDFCNETQNSQLYAAFSTLQNDVRQAATKIIDRKGATAHAIAFSAAHIVRAIILNERIVLPVSRRISQGLCASLPCVLGVNGASEPLTPPMTETERSGFDLSLSILREACKKLS